MKKLFIVLVLVASISQQLIAQNLVYKQNGLNKSIFDTEIVKRRNYVEIQFDKKNELKFWLKKLSDLKTIRNIDSLLASLLEDIQPFADSLSRPTADARKIQYYMTQENRNFQFKAYPAQEEVYTISKDKQIKAVKLRQDTIEIMFGSYNRQSNAFENKYILIFALNDWTDIRDIAKNGVTQYMDSIIVSLERKSSKIFSIKRGINAYYTPSSNNPPKIGYPELPPISINFGVGARFLKNQIVTSYDFDLRIAPHRNSIVSWMIGYESYCFFESTPDDPFIITRNNFLNAGIVFNKPAMSNNKEKVEVAGKISYGYLITRRGDYFRENTQRFSVVGITYKKRSSIEPELYFNGFFKNIYPGLKISIGF